MSVRTIKLVVVGDGAVGKTCLLYAYAKNEFPEGYEPTVLESYAVNFNIGFVKIFAAYFVSSTSPQGRAPHPGPVRHGGTGGLRQAPAPRLPRHGRIPRLLQPHDPWQLRKRQVGDREDLNDNDNNYAHLREKWIPEIRHHCPKTPFVLVGTKGDCRQDRGLVDKLGTNRIK